jgi:hypothetical protein
MIVDDPPAQPGLSPDPDDDYLIAAHPRRGRGLPRLRRPHLLDLKVVDPPVITPRHFLDLLSA